MPRGALRGDAESEQITARLSRLEHWTLDGRFAVRTDQDAGQGAIQWRHEKTEDRIYLSGPFGQGAVQIIARENFIEIDRGGGQTEVSTRPDVFLSEQLGFKVPLTALAYWVLALAAPHASYQSETNAQGRLSVLQQLDWKILYQRYAWVDEMLLPKKITVLQGPYVLKMVIDQWQL